MCLVSPKDTGQNRGGLHDHDNFRPDVKTPGSASQSVRAEILTAEDNGRRAPRQPPGQNVPLGGSKVSAGCCDDSDVVNVLLLIVAAGASGKNETTCPGPE